MNVRSLFVLAAVAVLELFVCGQSPGFNYAFVQIAGGPARAFAGLSFDEARGNWVLFGGETYNSYGCNAVIPGQGFWGETWLSDGASWTLATPVGPTPLPRAGAVMVYDRVRQNTVLFGGSTFSPCSGCPCQILGDTWIWDGIHWTQQFPLQSPSARSGAAAAWDPVRAAVVIHGGGVQGDTWAWNGQSWSQIATGPLSSSGSMAFDSQKNRLILLQGVSGTASGQTYELNGNTWTASAVHPIACWARASAFDSRTKHVLAFGGYAGCPGCNVGSLHFLDGVNWIPVAAIGLPSGRFGAAMSQDPLTGRVLLTGGYFGPGSWWTSGDAYLLEPVAPVDCSLVLSSPSPSSRQDHSQALLSGSGYSIVFGGTDGAQYFSDTWTWNGLHWSKEYPLHTPSMRSGHAMASGPQFSRVLLFGGRNPLGVARGDTWTFDGKDWTEHVMPPGPVARSGHAMAFDPTGNRVILFGGQDGSGTLLGDTWAFDGVAWTQMTASNGPSARSASAMASEHLRNRVVLYAGLAANGVQSDVWEWGGTQWTYIGYSSLSDPGARSEHVMAWDPRAERVVMFGGRNAASVCDGRVWTWDGTGWTLHMTAGPAPSPRSRSTMVADPVSGRLSLFGGECGSAVQETWLIELPFFSRWASYGSGCLGTLGIPQMQVTNDSAPVLGTTLQLRLTNIPGFIVPALGALGFSRLPLPLDLGPVGLPGCSLLNSAEEIRVIGPPSGTGQVVWSVPIPNLGQLLGAEVFFQGLCFELPGWPLWASLSNGLQVRLGNR
jgi:hypothetical protein